MAAPEYVPVKPMDDVRAYESPPRRPDQWRADRPGDLDGAASPAASGSACPGPDQGYALKLAYEVFVPAAADRRRRRRRRHRRLPRHRPEAGVALRTGARRPRPARVGVHALGLPRRRRRRPSSSALREAWFAEVAHPHHYAEARAHRRRRARVDAAHDATTQVEAA